MTEQNNRTEIPKATQTHSKQTNTFTLQSNILRTPQYSIVILLEALFAAPSFV